ncbi:hypothetical protein LXL04_001649 [Taraxacum kok-saghyz]
MLTDSQLLERLHDVLRTSDLDTATAATVRRKMEQDLGIDLSDRKPYIRQQIDLYLQSHYTNDNAEEDVEESENAKVEESDNDGSASEESDSEKTNTDSKSSKSTPKSKKKGGGFSKPCALSPQLQKFTGESEMARTEVVKKIWAYIKEKDLQNPTNKRKILCDETLHELFRVKSIDMFKMSKALSKHIWPIEEEYEAAVSVKPAEKKKQNKRVKEEETEENGKKQKTKGSGFATPLPISEALMEFFGTGENKLSRSQVVKRIWEYIKKNDLQDPSDKRRILCDDKLKELFKADTFIGFTVSKLLSPHFIKLAK